MLSAVTGVTKGCANHVTWGKSCFEHIVLRHVCDTIYLHSYPESENWMFYKINCVIFMSRRFIYYAMGTKLTNYKSLAF